MIACFFPSPGHLHAGNVVMIVCFFPSPGHLHAGNVVMIVCFFPSPGHLHAGNVVMIVCFFPSPGHLHAGNVVVVGGKTCCLLDIENWILGVPSYYRQFYTQFKKIMVSCPDMSRQSNWLEHLFRERNRLWYLLGKDDADNAGKDDADNAGKDDADNAVCGFCLFSGEAVAMSNAWTNK